MRSIRRAYKHALVTTATTGAAMSIALLSGAAPAWAHVHVDADDAAPGSSAVLTFRVPGESETGALTTQFSVALPNVSSVTWSAAPSVGISPDQFALFRISVTLPNQPSVSFPATQTYSDGKVVRWDQPPLPGGGEPEYPVPELALSGAPAPEHQMTPSPVAAAAPTGQPVTDAAPKTADDTARWLAGGALIVAAVGVVVAVVGRRRT
jgi:uncharacterized protein YcnI